ncbi:MAG: FecR family protein [Bacteroidales bacterium]|nr:FecR family protein [Bacteroidales bacterium]
MGKDFRHIPELIQKELCNKLNLDEEKNLSDWINYSDENELIYQKIISDENIEQQFLKYKRFSEIEAWDKLNLEIKYKTRKRVIYKAMQYAALLIVPLFITFFMLRIIRSDFLAKQESDKSLSSVELVLSDGKIVGLDDNNKKIISDVVYDGIINDSLNGLQYDNVKQTNSQTNLLAYNTLKVQRGGYYQLILSDGTKVWVNSDSELKFPINFPGKKREVWLKGEACFKVTHNSQKPFVVIMGEEKIRVLGTEFNVSAYSKDKNILATLVKGSIEFCSKNKVVNIIPNQQCIYNRKNKQAAVRKVDAYDFVAWRDGRFIFKSMSLENIMSQLIRWYDINVFFLDVETKMLKFRGEIQKDMNLKDVLNIISETTNVKFKVSNKKVYVSKKK